MRGDVVGTNVSQFDQDRGWLTANIGGPVLRDRLFFYGSYYRPTIDRSKRSNAYGELPDYQSTRDEFFGKLTYTPLSSILFNGSYRSSERTNDNASIGPFAAPTAALNEESALKVGILEGSWIVNSRSFASVKYTDFKNETLSIPGFLVSDTPSLALGTRLNIANLPSYGRLTVPTPITGQTAYNEFIIPFIQQYGYLSNGVRTGGGQVGSGLDLNDQDFFRKSAQAGYDFTIGSVVPNDIHIGYQWSEDAEELTRSSNGYGTLSVIGGRTNCPAGTACAGQPVFYQAQFTRSQLGGAVGGNTIRSEYVSKNIEINDTIRWKNWSFNVGVMASNDQLFGSGLSPDETKISGFVAAPGQKYKMYEIPWTKTIQPRLGATWAYNGSDNVYASYARYVPAASSLPRAASWDRSILGLTSRGYFDVNGNLIGSDQVGSSSGKLFADDLEPRTTAEYLIGTSQQLTSRLTARAYGR